MTFAGLANLPPGSVSRSTRADLDAFASDWPDFEHLFLDGYFGYANDSSDAPTDGRNDMASSVALMNPFLRGTVSIRSDDTASYPVVNPNWLTDPRDRESSRGSIQAGSSRAHK